MVLTNSVLQQGISIKRFYLFLLRTSLFGTLCILVEIGSKGKCFRQSFRIYLELFPTCSRKYNIRTIKWMNELPFELSNDLFLTSCQITQDLKKLENFRKESKSSSLLAIQNKNFYNFARNMPKSSIKRSIESAILPNF